MDHNGLMIKGVLSVNLLDVMDYDTENNKITCRLVLLVQKYSCTLLEPVLDYLSDDTIVSGMAISHIDALSDKNLMEMLIERQKSGGYRSSLWHWKKYSFGENRELFVILTSDAELNSAISISSKSGNLILYGLQ